MMGFEDLFKVMFKDWLEIGEAADPTPPPEEHIVFPVPVQVFIGDNDKTDEIDVEGYLRGHTLTVWFSGEDAFKDEEGELYFVPDLDIMAEARKYGGVGPFVVGTARVYRPDNSFGAQGTVSWIGGTVRFRFLMNGAKGVAGHGEFWVSDSKIKPDGRAWPFRARYGVKGSFTIDIP